MREASVDRDIRASSALTTSTNRVICAIFPGL
jgi:hypothetical protein